MSEKEGKKNSTGMTVLVSSNEKFNRLQKKNPNFLNSEQNNLLLCEIGFNLIKHIEIC